jgi:hypothetical protein
MSVFFDIVDRRRLKPRDHEHRLAHALMRETPLLA